MKSRRTLETYTARDDAAVAAPAASAKIGYPNDQEEASITPENESQLWERRLRRD